jgi:Arc/MetJ family transcription regulator
MSVKERITVTVDADVLAQIKEIVGTASTSSIVEQALREKLNRHLNARARLREMIAEAERRDPEGSARARERADRMMQKYFGRTP